MSEMTDWLSFVTAKTGLWLPAAISGATFLLTVLAQVLQGYTAPHIGHYRRNHGLITTFLIRNLNAVHYRKSLTVRVTAKDGVLESVVVQAGPWTPRTLPTPQSTPAGEYLDVRFSEVPSDGVFVIRTRVSDGVVRLEACDPDPADRGALKLKRDAFERPLPAFTPGRAFLHFLPRWLIGFILFSVIFVGSVWAGPDRMTVGDWSIFLLALVVAVLGFLLVVSYRGKSTIAGFDSGAISYQLVNHPQPTELGVSWRRPSLLAGTPRIETLPPPLPRPRPPDPAPVPPP